MNVIQHMSGYKLLFHQSTMRISYCKVANLFENEKNATIHAKGYQFDTYTSDIQFAQFVFNYVIN